MIHLKQQRGFSMLEVLITAIVVSIGILGVAGLQLYGIKNTHSANERVQAALLAYSIVDNMRANAVATRAGLYDIAASATPPAPLPNCIGEDKDCTTAELAIFDLVQWKNNLSVLNATGDGSIVSVTDADGFAQVTVTVTWADPLTRDATRSQFVLAVGI